MPPSHCVPPTRKRAAWSVASVGFTSKAVVVPSVAARKNASAKVIEESPTNRIPVTAVMNTIKQPVIAQRTSAGRTRIAGRTHTLRTEANSAAEPPVTSNAAVSSPSPNRSTNPAAIARRPAAPRPAATAQTVAVAHDDQGPPRRTENRSPNPTGRLIGFADLAEQRGKVGGLPGPHHGDHMVAGAQRAPPPGDLGLAVSDNCSHQDVLMEAQFGDHLAIT